MNEHRSQPDNDRRTSRPRRDAEDAPNAPSESSEQAGAVNRSRPIYPDAGRRPAGRPSRERGARGEWPPYRPPVERGERPAYGQPRERGDRPAYGPPRAGGERPANGPPRGRGERPAFRRRDDSAPRGERPSYPRRDSAPRGERPSYPRRDSAPRGERPSFPRRDSAPRGERPSYPRRDSAPRGERPSFPRRDSAPRGERPSYPRRDSAPRGERPSYPRRDSAPRGERPSYPRRDSAPRGERPSFPRRDDSAPRGERPSFPRRDSAPRGERPAYPRRDDPRNNERPRGRSGGPPSDRGERPRRFERGAPPAGGTDRGERPRFDRGDRPQRFPREDRAPRADRGGPPPSDRGDRPQRFDRADRPQRFARGDRPQRTGDRPPRPGFARTNAGGRAFTPGRGRHAPARPQLAKTWAGPPHIEEETPQLPDDPRAAALQILYAADVRSAFTDRMLDGAHLRSSADPRDQALLHELVKGTLRWRGRIDWILNQLVHIGMDKVQPWIKNILRLGAYQILFLERVPAHAAVDESVKLAHRHGHPGTAGLVNSVLRRLVEEKDNLAVPDGDDAASLAVWGSHPQWMVERWLDRFGVEATRQLLLANNRAAQLGLRANVLRGTRDQLITRLGMESVQAMPAEYAPELVWVEGRVAPGSLKAFKDGFCTAQDESEALVARLVAPEPHERLLDLCAAPGGKCTHLAELMGDEGEVWAMERAPERVASLQSTVDRLGAHAVHVVEGDGRTYTFPMPFDRVLVDAPCSGLGVLARRADARWRKEPSILTEMPPIQLDLLAAGARRARPGGVLVYSVCSFEPEETTEVVEQFLQQNPSFVLESIAGRVPDAVVDEQGFLRVLPHVHGCDGVFGARFRKA